ncbi:ribonuclease inhibitor-like isoform X2 [Poecilia latipinna]|uniref:ribonuclease inhibitor-like isoform X2 n=1 Tax=Poecilia latipinna TaxID=48699 RepID=UPI00072E09DF|nr:PREDICTED: ribonuclease inhibitor-like isoform X2 [Poecilia latipinna]
MAQEVIQEELDLDMYDTEAEKHEALKSVENYRRVRISGIELSQVDCEEVANALKGDPSNMIELEINTPMPSDALEIICGGLGSPNCKLQILRLRRCGLTKDSCDSLVAAFKSNPSKLLILDLSENDLEDAGVKKLWDFLQNPDCILGQLELENCNLSDTSCDYLGQAVVANPSHLNELDLGFNNLKKIQVQLLLQLRTDLISSLCRWRGNTPV